ncbi:MAG: hypothetical protein QOI01_6919 [Mycobacterium sp.]|nr:hypothetical protein [Mycobacterium sp.]
MWHDRRVAAGAFVRLVNTAPNFALFVVAPLFFVDRIGFSQGTYLMIVTVVYSANIFANLAFGILGDRFDWRRTFTWFGCVMCGVGILLLYYVPLLFGPNVALVMLCWAVFGIGLAGFVPLTALVPSMVPPEDRGSALAVYTLAAGLSAFVGPALVGLLGGFPTHVDADLDVRGPVRRGGRGHLRAAHRQRSRLGGRSVSGRGQGRARRR